LKKLETKAIPVELPVKPEIANSWVTKYHDGYIVIGWGSLYADFLIIDDERILLNYGVVPNNIKPKQFSV